MSSFHSETVESGFCKLAKTGINAELKVPSPNILRKRLGMVNANKKASPIREVPKVAKNRISLTKPSTLERRVAPLTSEKFFSKLNELPVHSFVLIALRKRLNATFTRLKNRAVPGLPKADLRGTELWLTLWFF